MEGQGKIIRAQRTPFSIEGKNGLRNVGEEAGDIPVLFLRSLLPGKIRILQNGPDGRGRGLAPVLHILLMVSASLPLDCHRDQMAFLAQNGFAVFDAQKIVWGSQKAVPIGFSVSRLPGLILPDHGQEGGISGLGPAGAPAQFLLDPGGE